MSKVLHHVVIQTAFLGDLFLAIPLLKSLKELFPDDHVILVCKTGLGDYFLAEKLVDHVIEVKKNDRESYVIALAKLNILKIGYLFCVHRSIRSLLLSFQINAKTKIGFKSFLGGFVFKHTVHFKKDWPEALRQLWILSAVDPKVQRKLLQGNWAVLNRADNDGNLAKIPAEFCAPHRSLTAEKQIAIFPGSVWATKKWTEDGFSQVAAHFSSLGYKVFLMGGPDERIICENIKKLVPACEINAGQKTILESVTFIKSCHLVISNDSAPTHMAASQNIPVLTIYGPTTLNLGFRPWSSNAMVVQNNNLSCRPCGKHGHQKCPLGHHHCMTEISSQAVIRAATALLSSSH